MGQNKNEHSTPAAGWFMNAPFQAYQVYSRLKEANYTFIVGLDIGHGETIAYLFSLEETADQDGTTVSAPKVVRLRLNHEDDAKVPTILRFADDRTIVGRKAKNAQGFFQHFKTEPEKWDRKIDQVHTHGGLMEAFIGTMWQQILQYQPKLAEAVEQDRVLLTVGCPASDAWTGEGAMSRYEALIRQATHCAHVSVLPESTAAIMAAVLSAEETVPPYKLALEQGIAVLDAGSSTLDFTYVQMGNTLRTRSLRLGGHDLDEQMLEVAMEDSGLTRDQIPMEQRQTLLVQLREMKEAFYPNRESLGIQVIPIWGVDAAGRADADLPSSLQLKFTMNAAFLERALNRKAIQLHGHLSARQSWLELCGEFVQFTGALAGSCDKIILTGGTSFVTELRDMVRAVYGDRVIQSRDPSSSVAKGLCYAESLELRGNRYVEPYQAMAKQVSDTQYQAFVKEFAQYTVQVVFDDMADSANGFAAAGGKITVGQFIDDINRRAQEDDRLIGREGQEKVQELFARHFADGTVKIYEEVNKISAGIYGANLESVPKFSRLTNEQTDAILRNLDMARMIDRAWITTIVPATIFSGLSAMLALAGVALTAAGQPLAGGALALLALALDNENFREKIVEVIQNNNTQIKAGFFSDLVQKLTNPAKRDKNIRKAASKAAESVKKTGVLQTEFVSGLEDQAEMALGKVLFLVYDNKPD